MLPGHQKGYQLFMIRNDCLFAGTLLVTILTSGCFYAAVPAPSPSPAAVITDPRELEAKAVTVLGGAPDTRTVVKGPVSMTPYQQPVIAGHCYDVGVASGDAVVTSARILAGPTMRYPFEGGNTGQGSTVRVSFCADADGRVSLVFTSHQQFNPVLGALAMLQEAQFGVASRARPESAEERAARHAREREIFVARRSKECEDAANTYTCMKALEAELEERDREAPPPPPPPSGGTTSAPGGPTDPAA